MVKSELEFVWVNFSAGSASASPSASTFSGNSDSVITRTRTQVRRRLPTFFSDIKKSSFFCLYGAKKGEVICIWQPAAVRRERRLGPWLCDTGFRLLCLFLYSCSSASRTDICVCQYFMFTVYQICPKTQGDFQKIYKILTELITDRKKRRQEIPAAVLRRIVIFYATADTASVSLCWV